MSNTLMHTMENCLGRLMEKTVDIAECLCPPLKKFLSWEFIDDGSLFAIHDEDFTPRQTKDAYGVLQDDSAAFKERGDFARRAAARAA